MRAFAYLLILATHIASADEPSLVVRVPERWQDGGPMLHLEERAIAEGLGGAKQGETSIFQIGPGARVVMSGEWWTNDSWAEGKPHASSGELDVGARGWRARFELGADVGPFWLGVHVAAGRVDGRFEQGTYRDIGVSLLKRFRLSRWMLAWIGLTIGHRQWLGDAPPPGEQNGPSLMLTVGTTFR